MEIRRRDIVLGAMIISHAVIFQHLLLGVNAVEIMFDSAELPTSSDLMVAIGQYSQALKIPADDFIKVYVHCAQNI